MADPILKTYATQAVRHLEQAGAHLVGRQQVDGAAGGVGATAGAGNVPPWPGSADEDFHGTLGASWIWARHELLSGERRFAGARELAWAFVDRAWPRFIPEALGPDASDEAPFDCAMVLRAAVAELALPPAAGGWTSRVKERAAGAARLLSAYLAELHELSGRDFQDPGFLAWNLVDYGRAVQDRGLLAAGRGFVERAFGMKAPPGFAAEAESAAGLFDFSSTTATRVLATLASEGDTPFVGAWLRERVAPAIHPVFLPRNVNENCWNACVAVFLGRAYVISTDPRFLEAYRSISGELARRDFDLDAAIPCDSRDDSRTADSLATFYYSLAVDALLRHDGGVAPSSHPPRGGAAGGGANGRG